MFKVLPPGLMGGQRRDGRGGKLGRQTERQGWDRGGGGSDGKQGETDGGQSGERGWTGEGQRRG